MTESAQEGQPVDYLKMAQERAEIIKMLVGRRHPFAGHKLANEEENGRAAAYIKELQAMTHEDLLRLQAEQKERERLRALSELERLEANQFYSQPTAQADFVLWAQRATWGIAEGVALLLGKSPDVVTLDRMQSSSQKLPLPAKFNELYKIALSHSYPGGQLSQRMYPHVFLRWAERYDKQIPPELLAAVKKYSGNLVDWQDVCATYKKEAETWQSACDALKVTIAQYEQTTAQASQIIEAQRRRISELEAEVAALEDIRDGMVDQSTPVVVTVDQSPDENERRGQLIAQEEAVLKAIRERYGDPMRLPKKPGPGKKWVPAELWPELKLKKGLFGDANRDIYNKTFSRLREKGQIAEG